MRLPGETQAEFFIMIPMVPSRRDNMIAWLAARCDAPDYGKLIVYEFPRKSWFTDRSRSKRVFIRTPRFPSRYRYREPDGARG